MGTDAAQGGKSAVILDDFAINRNSFLAALAEVPGNERVTSATPEGVYEALGKYGRDLVNEARTGKLEPVIGRDQEIRRAIQILSRKTKNNPVLVGEPGVGKTAIVEGLAHRIITGDVLDGATITVDLDGDKLAVSWDNQPALLDTADVAAA